MEWLTPIIIGLLLFLVAGFFLYLIRQKTDQPSMLESLHPTENSVSPDVVSEEQINPDGYEFIAHLTLSTPLEVLEHHYEKHPGPRNLLPRYGNYRHGSWMLILQSWEDVISADSDAENDELENEFTFSETETVESDIGVMPVDGGMYLEFLKAFRRIVESDADPERKRNSIYALAIISDDYQRFINKHVEEDENWLEPYLGTDK